MITQEELKKVLDYDPVTGIFTWKIKRTNAVKVGGVAGNVDKIKPYIRICIGFKRYQAHRLAFLYMTGEYPTQQVDHIDCNGLNNAFSNLRLVTLRQNLQNKQIHRDGRLVGASLRVDGKWASRISIDGKQMFLGYFDTEQEAHDRYVRELNRIGETLI
jgi:hypothetical protein